ncbi:MAG TPA: hypothetical protein VMQ61_16500 [Thermoanaerobaculia bacterium]|nr:hypothetical protein [Thermoanaerobaculia bacterium]
MKRAAAVLLMSALALGCREKGRPDPDVRMAISHQPTSESETPETSGENPHAAGQGQNAPRVPDRLEVPDAVKQAYSGVSLVWRDATTGKTGALSVPLGGSAELPGSGLTVAADVFLPAFTMSNEVITSSGIEPENPAARIRVSEGGKEIFSGWIFKRFPDVHPFTHPRFSLRLDGGVRKT